MTDEKRKALSLHVGQAVAVGASDSISCFLSPYRRLFQIGIRVNIQVDNYRMLVYGRVEWPIDSGMACYSALFVDFCLISDDGGRTAACGSRESWQSSADVHRHSKLRLLDAAIQLPPA